MCKKDRTRRQLDEQVRHMRTKSSFTPRLQWKARLMIIYFLITLINNIASALYLYFTLKVFYCIGKLWARNQHVFAITAVSEVKKITAWSVTSGWVVANIQHTYAATAISVAKKITAWSVINGWRAIRLWPWNAITAVLVVANAPNAEKASDSSPSI